MELLSIIPSNHYNHELGLDYPFANWHYLHGNLESDAGYDCFHVNKIPDTDGLFSCIVQFDKYAIHAYWFKWSDLQGRQHGLVVQQNDIESIEFAMQKYMAKPSTI
jgi:hypothetical protein